jgi:hypothetical protein
MFGTQEQAAPPGNSHRCPKRTVFGWGSKVDYQAQVQKFRQRAEECRTLAEIATDAAATASYLRFAEAYDTLANVERPYEAMSRGVMAKMTDPALPWSKREIVRAMVGEYRPFNLDDVHTGPFYSQLRALLRLGATGKGPPGFCDRLDERVKTYLEKRDGAAFELSRLFVTGVVSETSLLEHAVFLRLGRVYQALKEGRDPDTAYETPLRGEM